MPDGQRTPDGIGLSKWQNRQREWRKDGRLAEDRIKLLDELGFCWDPLLEAWHARYQELRAWKQARGHFRFPAGHPLRGWLHRQRRHARDGQLSSEQAALLRDLGALDDPEPEGTEP